MTHLLLATRLRSFPARDAAPRDASDARDAGQGTLEYVGMLIAVAVVVAGVIAVLKGVDVGGAVSRAFNTAFG